jgi:periplasmic protein TonB
MTALAADRYDLGRWAAAAALVIGLHAALAGWVLRHHEPFIGDEGGPAIVVDLAPFVTPSSDSRQDLAPGPEQQMVQQPPEPPREQKPEEQEKPKVEPPPPAPDAEVTLPPEEVKPEPPKPVPQPEQPRPTAPPRQRTASAAAVTAWNVSIAKQIERNKGYPPSALPRREMGVTQVAFAIDRDGRVIESRVTRSSGYRALDQEAMDTLRRAQPFPRPPDDLPGEKFEFTVPVKFNVVAPSRHAG